MKIQCNVCEMAEATVLCCADEAALCSTCDEKVHAANKLASKHQRIHLSTYNSQMPMCDICQVDLELLRVRMCDEVLEIAVCIRVPLDIIEIFAQMDKKWNLMSALGFPLGITPAPFGEGKSTTIVGLCQPLRGVVDKRLINRRFV
ncbi:hypothetical protein Ccrd_020769, partial [Cynara cardunculus var. scolymus]